jgi:hypothetical protein
MNSPLERHEVHLRGLDGDVGLYGACHVERHDTESADVIPREAPPGTVFSREAVAPTEESTVRTAVPDARSHLAVTGSGRAGAADAAHGRTAESAEADFVNFQRRIHSLPGCGRHLTRLEGECNRTEFGERSAPRYWG